MNLNSVNSRIQLIQQITFILLSEDNVVTLNTWSTVYVNQEYQSHKIQTRLKNDIFSLSGTLSSFLRLGMQQPFGKIY